MKPLSEKEFKEYVVQKAKEYIFETTDNLPKSAINESKEDDTLASVKNLVSVMKKTSESLSFREPILEQKAEVAPEPDRKFHVGSYENVSIDLKDTLDETMRHYNKQKDLKHGKEAQSNSWTRLTEYKKYSED
jgi:hypothetical protein